MRKDCGIRGRKRKEAAARGRSTRKCSTFEEHHFVKPLSSTKRLSRGKLAKSDKPAKCCKPNSRGGTTQERTFLPNETTRMGKQG